MFLNLICLKRQRMAEILKMILYSTFYRYETIKLFDS